MQQPALLQNDDILREKMLMWIVPEVEFTLSSWCDGLRSCGHRSFQIQSSSRAILKKLNYDDLHFGRMCVFFVLATSSTHCNEKSSHCRLKNRLDPKTWPQQRLHIKEQKARFTLAGATVWQRQRHFFVSC